MYNILICDDDRDIVNALKIYLSNSDYILYEAYNGNEALDIIHKQEIHLVLLDIMMPELDGIHTLTRLREITNIPVILLTAKSEDIDIILGLNAGADDYITKPYNPMEVSARVRSQLRRYFKLGSNPVHEAVLRIGGIELDDKAKLVTLDGEQVSLTPKEYEILLFLMQNPGKVYSPKELYRAIWKEKPLGADNTVAVHIRHLREKLEINPAEPRYIKVVFGQGYKSEKGRDHENA